MPLTMGCTTADPSRLCWTLYSFAAQLDAPQSGPDYTVVSDPNN